MRLGLCLVLLCAGACGAGPPVPPVEVEAVVAPLELGTRGVDDAFFPLVDGQEVTLEAGAQGGFHVWLRYRYGGATGGAARLLRSAYRVIDDAIVLRTSAEVVVVPESPPLAMFMCPSPIGLSVIDQPIVFRLELDGEGGEALARQDITLVPRCPEAARELCLRICTG